MGKKGSKANSSEKAAAKAAKRAKQEKSAQKKALKTEKKATLQAASKSTAKSSGKSSKKSGGGKFNKASPAEEEDLDALLAKFKQDWEQDHAVFEEKQSGAPSRRANATLTPCPLGNDLWLFGGEYFDGEKANFYADLYRYTPYSGSSSSKETFDGPSSQSTLDRQLEALTSSVPPEQPSGSAGSDTIPAAYPTSSTAAVETKDRGEWRTYSSKNQPGPRSAHQIVATPASGGLLWLFGGEFASGRMTSFHHYRDLWLFSIASKTWERIEAKPSKAPRPSARSGHRMCAWKQWLVLFGGFVDAGARTTYLNDLWLFDTATHTWTEIRGHHELRRPSARSGFSLVPVQEGVVLHGGYCKRYVKGQRTQGVALEDTWLLRMGEDPVNKCEWVRRRKIGTAPNPSRSGCTMTHWAARGIGVLFGGVTDTEADEESLDSVFHDQLYGYQLAGAGRWIHLQLRKPKKMGGQGGKRKRERAAAMEKAKLRQQEQRRKEAMERAEEERKAWAESDDDEHGDGDPSSDDDDDLEGEDGGDSTRAQQRRCGADQSSQAEQTEATGAPSAERTVAEADDDRASSVALTQAMSLPADEDLDEDRDDPKKTTPLARYNAMLAVQRNVLYIYGGIFETGNREYTLDDFYTLDLSKMDRFHCLKACPIDALEWFDSEDEDSDEEDEEDGSSSSSESDSDDEDGEGVAQEGVEYVDEEEEPDEQLVLGADDEVDEEGNLLTPADKRRIAKEKEELRERANKFLGVSKDVSNRTEEDVMSTPLPGETVAHFYERTKAYWAIKALEHAQGASSGPNANANLRGKELRRDAFGVAKERYEEYRPLLREIEKIQEEAGLDREDMRRAAAAGNGGHLAAAAAATGIDSRNRR